MQTTIPVLIQDLGMNAGLLAVLCVVYGTVTTRSLGPDEEAKARCKTWNLLIGGVLFGVVGILSMMSPVQIGEGVILDVKTVVAALATAYLPAWPAAIALTIMAGFRAALGGVGMYPALVAIVLSAGLGLVLRGLRGSFSTQFGPVAGTWAWLATFGVSVASAGMASTLLLPAGVRAVALPAMLASVVLIYPLSIVAAGYLLESILGLRTKEAESRAMEQQLRQSLRETRKIASIFENSQDTIAIISTDGIFLEVNPTYCATLGYQREELIGMPLAKTRVDEQGQERLEAVLKEIEQAGRWRGEVTRRRKNGDIFTSEITIEGLLDEDGVMRRLVSIGRDLTEKKQMQEAVSKAGHFDHLSGLPNRRLVTDMLGKLVQPLAPTVKTMFVKQSLRNRQRRMAVCVFDIDDFKLLNDRLGHSACDAILIELAFRLKHGASEGNLVGRLGGDEFAVVFDDFTNSNQAISKAKLIQEELAKPIEVPGGGQVVLHSSVGITLYPDDWTDADGLLRHADIAMYAAKEAGKNQIVVFDTHKDLKAQIRRENIRTIDSAIDAQQMTLYFQPKVRLSDNKVVGAEALIRWNDPDRGLRAPGEFLGDIAGTPTAAKLDHWVLREAMRIGAGWAEQGLTIPISVNMTVTTLTDREFVSAVRSLLKQYSNLPFNFLEVELLETETLNDLSQVAFVIQELAENGVQCSIDDFGTGYSSLTYLQRLPAQIIKIDQSFVRDMLEDERDLTLVKGIIGLTKAFDRVVVAEGVETMRHAAHLRAMGCDVIQGYGIAKPMPAESVPAWIERWESMPGAGAATPALLASNA